MEMSYIGLDALLPSLFLCPFLSLLSTLILTVTFAGAQDDPRVTATSQRGHHKDHKPVNYLCPLAKVKGTGTHETLPWPPWETE